MRIRYTIMLAAISGAIWIGAIPGRAAGPKFYPDDPLWRDPETQDARTLQELEFSQQYDLVANSFLGAGEKTDVRALNVNTLDEVPDSSWFTNRVGRKLWTTEQFAKGPDTGTGPSGDRWTIISGKTEGITPGMTITDGAGQAYFLKFDPPSNPEMASGAEAIVTKFLYAFGYYTPENYIASIRREALDIDPGAQVVDPGGRRRAMEPRDVDALLKKAARREDGSYRVLASKALEGKPVGRFRYYGTRPDDPNDIFAHEHRRELRGLVVFAAWLNHDNVDSGNTFDTLVQENGRWIVRHHLLDFGSALGSGSIQAQTPRAGNEYVWESRPTLITMLTLGFYVRPWIKIDYPDIPAVGRFEATYFRPEAWKPQYANPAFLNARPEDHFWAARILAALPDSGLRAVVRAAQYSDPRATEYIVDTLMARKRKILRHWLNGTNPIANPRLDASGVLTFENAAERAAVASAADHYTIRWSTFDNATGTHGGIGEEQTVREPNAQAPPSLLTSRSEYIAAELRAFHADQPAWEEPLMVYFRREAAGWAVVGLQRGIEPKTMEVTKRTKATGKE
jgi:hypothetical protein